MKKFRALIIILLILSGAAFYFYKNEKNAGVVFSSAKWNEDRGNFDAAILGYDIVLKKYPYSYSAYKAKERLTEVLGRHEYPVD